MSAFDETKFVVESAYAQVYVQVVVIPVDGSAYIHPTAVAVFLTHFIERHAERVAAEEKN